jgi:hypothetical protein
MSQENVEIVRAASRRGTPGPVSRTSPSFTRLSCTTPRADEPDPSPHVGRDAYERLVRGFVESFLEVTDRAQHRRSDHVYKMRDGLVVEGWEYRTRQEALEAVGLKE